jgi:hypothetical protein
MQICCICRCRFVNLFFRFTGKHFPRFQLLKGTERTKELGVLTNTSAAAWRTTQQNKTTSSRSQKLNSSSRQSNKGAGLHAISGESTFVMSRVDCGVRRGICKPRSSLCSMDSNHHQLAQAKDHLLTRISYHKGWPRPASIHLPPSKLKHIKIWGCSLPQLLVSAGTSLARHLWGERKIFF